MLLLFDERPFVGSADDSARKRGLDRTTRKKSRQLGVYDHPQ